MLRDVQRSLLCRLTPALKVRRAGATIKTDGLPLAHSAGGRETGAGNPHWRIAAKEQQVWQPQPDSFQRMAHLAKTHDSKAARARVVGVKCIPPALASGYDVRKSYFIHGGRKETQRVKPDGEVKMTVASFLKQENRMRDGYLRSTPVEA